MRPRLDPAWLDAEYNDRAAIPDHAAIFDAGSRHRSAARAGSPVQADIAYGDGAGETLDVFPAAQAGAPVLVFVHGGYWRSRDKSDFSFIAPSFNAAGAMVVLPNYALCPAVDDRAHHAADGAGAGLDLAQRRALRRRPDAHRRGRALGRRPPGGDAAVVPLEAGGRRPAAQPGDAARCRSRACTTWSRCATPASCSPTCS